MSDYSPFERLADAESRGDATDWWRAELEIAETMARLGDRAGVRRCAVADRVLAALAAMDEALSWGPERDLDAMVIVGTTLGLLGIETPWLRDAGGCLICGTGLVEEDSGQECPHCGRMGAVGGGA